jgi:hypothetical protein
MKQMSQMIKNSETNTLHLNWTLDYIKKIVLITVLILYCFCPGIMGCIIFHLDSIAQKEDKKMTDTVIDCLCILQGEKREIYIQQQPIAMQQQLRAQDRKNQ